MSSTQTYKLYEILKSGQPVAVAKIAEELDIKVLSVPVYIHGLKKLEAKITPVREGRKVVAYQLINAEEIKIPEFRKNSAELTKPAVAKALVSSISDELSAANSGLPSDKDLADIRMSLDLDADHGSRAD